MLFLAASIALQLAAPTALLDVLPRGPHAVGFSQQWLTDSSRRLPNGERYDLRLRPVLMNVWYPAVRSAEGAAGRVAGMRYDDYFAGAERVATSAPLRRYAGDLIAYQRRTAWTELTGAPRDSAPEPLRRRVDSLLASVTGVLRDAPRLAGRHPVVVYAQGAGSSMDDNALLCEFLASRGYIVLGSAYPAEANDRFSTSASDESRQRDIKRMLLELTRMLGADPGPVALIGHSAGAQAGFLMASDPSAPLDALLSLDTTEDYAGLSDPAWAYFTTKTLAHRREIRIPVLFAADPTALFELADSLSASPRSLATIPAMDHNDFISQGILSRRVKKGVEGDDTAAHAAAERGYRALGLYIADWLDAFFAGAAPPDRAPNPLTVATIARGVAAPAPDAIAPRSAREVRHDFWTRPPVEFADRARRARMSDSSIVTDGVLVMLLADAVRRDDVARARLALTALGATLPEVVKNIDARIKARARLFERIGSPELARPWNDLSRLLFPN